MPKVVGEYLDRLATVEMRQGGHDPWRGITRPIYDVVLRKQGRPATMLAAELLLDALHEDDVVFCLTGAGVPPWMPKGETDGPPGLAAVARALHLGRGVRPVFVVADHHRDITVATLDGIGLNVLSLELASARYWPAAVVEVMPYSDVDTSQWTRELFDRYRPKSIVACEKLGPNERGVIHSATGIARGPEIDAARLLREAEARGLPRVCIGDVGNELGYGIVHDEVAEILAAHGVRCQCPCGGSIVSAVGCDALIHAACSDWGGYGLAAALAFLLGDSRLLVPPDLQRRGLEACVAAGAIGRRGRQVVVDGTSLDVQLVIVRLLRELVDLALSERRKRPF